MEKEINIAEILKDKPKGTSLWSTILGKCTFEDIHNDQKRPIRVKSKNGEVDCRYTCRGRYLQGFEDTECVLFPSKEMHDWEKFAWKKGDVLVNQDGTSHIIFEKFKDDIYVYFIGKYRCREIGKDKYFYRNNASYTGCYTLETDAAAVQTYINTIEEKLGGKLNRETLEIEKQPKFKDGDIVVSNSGAIILFKEIKCRGRVYYHACMIKGNVYVRATEDEYYGLVSCIDRLATDTEKKQLFDALEKKGKAWDAEKKQIVDLPKQHEFKPFDCVITRVDDDAIRTANIFSHIDQLGKYVTIGCLSGYHHCIPYNEETAKLIGTTKDMEV